MDAARAFQTFGGFISGIGIHYLPSTITNTDYETAANANGKVAIGKRFPPHAVIRAADSKPVDLQDLLPADGKFRLLAFFGDEDEMGFRSTTSSSVGEIGIPEVVVKLSAVIEQVIGEFSSEAFDVLSILTVDGDPRESALISHLVSWPLVLRSHWSK